MSEDPPERDAYAQTPDAGEPQSLADDLVRRALAEPSALLRRLIVGEVLAQRSSAGGLGRPPGRGRPNPSRLATRTTPSGPQQE